eukprot:TRINITY_DN5581_c0_g1_i1.p1 TRINITY_DN5581_c0_g1~~TRINITY_DN5581_c0_g1_i1.p1  ORF type:complete len:366 (+),score=76.86 TRINITY_DN5581_c0_g1_i1:2-1099(+)
MPELWEQVAFSILSSIYGAFFGVCLSRLVRMYRLGTLAPANLSLHFHSLILVLCGVRCVWNGLEVLDKNRIDKDEENPKNFWDDIASTLPAFIFFSTFLLLVCFWAELYYTFTGGLKPGAAVVSESEPLLSRSWVSISLRMQLVYFNVFIVLMLATLYSARWIAPDTVTHDIFVKSVYSFVGFICTVCTIVFFYYGNKLKITFSETPGGSVSVRRQRIVRTIVGVTSVTFLCLVTRTVLVFAMGWNKDLYESQALSLSYYVVTELVPLSLILYILRRVPGTPAAPQENSRLFHSGGQQQYNTHGSDSKRVGSVIPSLPIYIQETPTVGSTASSSGMSPPGSHTPLATAPINSESPQRSSAYSAYA